MANTTRIRRLCWWLLVLGVANFMVCAVARVMIGGDGWRGYVDHGRYSVAGHGVYTEVGRAKFVYTRVHLAASVIWLVVAAVAGVNAA